MRDVIPAPVFDQISEHFRTAAPGAARNAWRRGNQDEDTVTGDFLGRLSTDNWQSQSIDAEEWAWRVDYSKLRGRGPGAPEKEIGADGLVTIEVRSLRDGTRHVKSLLFQAKKHRVYSDAETVGQVKRIEAVAPGSSAVFEYGEDSFTALPGPVVGSSRREVDDSRQAIGSFLGEAFLSCTHGVRGLYFDAVRQLLVITPPDGPPRLVALSALHRLKVDVSHGA